MPTQISRHPVAGHRIAAAVDDFAERLAAAVDAEQEGGSDGAGWSIITGLLLDYVGARSLTDPELTDPTTRLALSSAAETATGAVAVPARPAGERLAVTVSYTGTGVAYGPGPVERTSLSLVDWLDAWRLGSICRASSFVVLQEARRLLPEAGTGQPVNLRLRLAQSEAMYHDQLMRPEQGAAVLDRALAQPDEADPVLVAELTALRSLLARDRQAFDRDLVDLLHRHRAAASTDARPATLLPLGPLSLACLAVDDLGWGIAIESGYLPRTLLNPRWTAS
jgi:hypothetical protein